MNKWKDIGFYFITDSSMSKDGIISDVKKALKAGCKIIQYREKNKSTREMIEEAEVIKAECSKKALFLINDRVDIALAVDADGIHIGQDDIPVEIAREILGNEKIIGLSVNSIDEAIKAQNRGINYLALGPIFQTNTKKNAKNPTGTLMIKKIKEQVNLPLIAIGGINKNNITEVLQAGADSIAAISAIFSSDDVYKELHDFKMIMKENRQK